MATMVPPSSYKGTFGINLAQEYEKQQTEALRKDLESESSPVADNLNN